MASLSSSLAVSRSVSFKPVAAATFTAKPGESRTPVCGHRLEATVAAKLAVTIGPRTKATIGPSLAHSLAPRPAPKPLAVRVVQDWRRRG
jgi:hypothetical protein